LNKDEITALLARREEAVRELAFAKGRVVTAAESVAEAARLPNAFRVFMFTNMREHVRDLEDRIADLERVVAETNPVFDEVAERIG